jgi:hypothetical protein
VLLRAWRRGRAHIPGFLEDYGAVAAGLVDLFEAGFDPVWLRWGEELAATMLARFEDPVQGGCFGSPDPDGELLFPHKPLYDGALPSGNTLAARALLRLGRHLEREDFQASAMGILRCAAPLMAQAPGSVLGLLGVLDQAQSSLEVVIAGAPEAEGTRALLAAARLPYLPNRLLSMVAADPALPLHRHRDGQPGPAAYVCRDQACAEPVADPGALTALLQRDPG